MAEEPVGLRRVSASRRRQPSWRRLGEVLRSQHVVTRAQLLTALDRQADLVTAGRSYQVGRVLVGMGLASQEQIEAALAQQARYPARRAQT